LIPYLPQAFKLNFLPPFYFIYWIIILAIIAITHEFAHGIFMRLYGIKIKSTGFGFFPFFLPVFLAAFVEQDEKSMKKASRFEQKAVLSAGTFANIITAIIGFFIMILFFSCAYSPSGVAFDDYAYGIVPVDSIYSVNNIIIENPSYEKIVELVDEEGFSQIESDSGTYFLNRELLEKQINVEGLMILYLDAPAIKSNLKGIISEINGVEINDVDGLAEELYKYSPGEQITLGMNDGEGINNHDLILGENPQSGKAWMGVVFEEVPRKGIVGRMIKGISSFRKPHVYYEPSFDSADFIYNFLWWLVLISFSVALVNMLPMGIFDGGRFFYLTILGLTKSKKKAENWFRGITKFLLFLVLVLMIFWAISFF
jgi:membrane-associated protease RseP (regulator of RpoE activity)